MGLFTSMTETCTEADMFFNLPEGFVTCELEYDMPVAKTIVDLLVKRFGSLWGPFRTTAPTVEEWTLAAQQALLVEHDMVVAQRMEKKHAPRSEKESMEAEHIDQFIKITHLCRIAMENIEEAKAVKKSKLVYIGDLYLILHQNDKPCWLEQQGPHIKVHGFKEAVPSHMQEVTQHD